MIFAKTHIFDIAVVGGGPAGIAAAVAAARMGCSVALVERYPILGGMGTVGLVGNFCPAHWNGRRFIIGGIMAELRRRLIDRGAIYTTTAVRMEPYDPEVFAAEAQAICAEAKVKLFLNRPVSGVDFPDTRRCRLQLRDGAMLESRAVVDATGDAFVAWRVCPFTFGRDEDHAVMPLTYCYIAGPVNIQKVKRKMPGAIRLTQGCGEEYVSLGGQRCVNEWLAQARRRREVSIPRDHVSTAVSVPGRPRYVMVNYGRITVQNPTDPAELALASEKGKCQAKEGVRFFRKYVPGFENIRIDRMAMQIGVRESRQIAGQYRLTGKDVLACRQFDDVIAQCCYPIDIHEPDSDRTTMKCLPDGRHYDIPWRCLIPRSGPENLVVGGRCISATHEAMSSLRVIPPAMATGEAAGVTAALAVQNQCAIRDVKPQKVQRRLRETGGILS